MNNIVYIDGADDGMIAIRMEKSIRSAKNDLDELRPPPLTRSIFQPTQCY